MRNNVESMHEVGSPTSSFLELPLTLEICCCLPTQLYRVPVHQIQSKRKKYSRKFATPEEISKAKSFKHVVDDRSREFNGGSFATTQQWGHGCRYWPYETARGSTSSGGGLGQENERENIDRENGRGGNKASERTRGLYRAEEKHVCGTHRAIGAVGVPFGPATACRRRPQPPPPPQPMYLVTCWPSREREKKGRARSDGAGREICHPNCLSNSLCDVSYDLPHDKSYRLWEPQRAEVRDCGQRVQGRLLLGKVRIEVKIRLQVILAEQRVRSSQGTKTRQSE
ncbi:hypothetical protein WN55_09401 [Dufourea novaeangliae]|uniref:Uncharacterized protein n=1 Tax=Dufourea novaeangliae TaxID=178035 RepID=A0A154P655_DUFNO|nr:hypothetical protein WN55_09401 [Dufourea novaeangliae]